MTNSYGGFGEGISALGGSQQQRRTNQTKGYDCIKEVAILVQRCKPNIFTQEWYVLIILIIIKSLLILFKIERTQRCSLLSSINSTGKLLEFAPKSKLRREQIMILNIALCRPDDEVSTASLRLRNSLPARRMELLRPLFLIFLLVTNGTI